MPRPKLLVVDDNLELLLLLTHLFEDAGYEVVSASKGKAAIELLRAEVPALAVLDILLPDMMGYAVADVLKREHPRVPIVFVTGVFKGGKPALDARAKYGTSDWFEKPFEARKLLEAVARHVPARREDGPPPEEFEVELDIDIEEEEPQEAMELSGRIQVHGSGNLSMDIRGQTLTASPLGKGSDPNIRRAPADRPSAMTSPKSGALRDNLPQLINAFWLSRETGELGVQKGQVKKVVYFERGAPVFALSNLVSDRLGQFLVRTGRIQSHQFADVATVAQETKRRTGDVLIERGLLKEPERLYYVGQQVKSIIYSLFAWEEGAFVMTFGGKGVAEPIKLDVHPANLILRGVKKLYKPERVRRLLHLEDRLQPSREPAYRLSDMELETWESELFPRADGTRTVAELIAMAQRPERVVQVSLTALLGVRALEKAG